MCIYIYIYILLLYSYIVYVCVLEVSELMVPVQLWEAITAVAFRCFPRPFVFGLSPEPADLP